MRIAITIPLGRALIGPSLLQAQHAPVSLPGTDVLRLLYDLR